MNPQAPADLSTNPHAGANSQPRCDKVEAAIKSGPGGATNTVTPGPDHRYLEAPVADHSILTPTQRLLLIRSIAGHITPATTTEQADQALARIERILDGDDPLAGDA